MAARGEGELVRDVLGECTVAPSLFTAMAFLARAAAGTLESPIREDHTDGHRGHGESKYQGGGKKNLHEEAPRSL